MSLSCNCIDESLFSISDCYMKKKRILKLTLKKKWFDMILSGVKKEEYRSTKEYWEKRLQSWKCGAQRGYKEFDYVQFYNGGHYSDDLPNFTIECKGIRVKTGRIKWGASPGVKYFAIKLGDIVEKKNIKDG